jgi:predicted HTH domain antitoxin
MMARAYSLVFASIFLLTLGGCQSLEQISIDYLKPAELSFPTRMRKVAIVNNMSDEPDNKLIVSKGQAKEDELGVAVAYANGDPKIATESLADHLAQQNYFDEVMICDSALRAADHFARENTLSPEEVNRLTRELGVDFLISLENLQIKARKSVEYLMGYDVYRGVIDAKVYPTLRIYLPNRTRPMNTLQLQDSIFWDNYGPSPEQAYARLIPDKELLQQASDFAGTIPVSYLVPIWQKASRVLYSGGSVAMRDAAVYAREENWDKAYPLWKEAYDESKSEKKKMRAAYNIAVYYEMKDSLATAEEWAVKAQQFALNVEGKHIDKEAPTRIDDVPNYVLISQYVADLKERNAQLPKVKLQMSRFNNDF